MMLRKVVILFLVAVTATMFNGTPVPAAESDKPVIEPLVEELLMETSRYLESAEQFTFHAEIAVDDLLPTGQKVQYGASFDAAMKRPDKIHTVYRGDLRDSASWYDGKTFTFMNKGTNMYAVWEAPSKIDGFLDRLNERLGMTVPFSNMMRSDPYRSFADGIQVGIHAGMHRVDGVLCHHLLLRQEDVDAQVWIEAGKQLVPRKIVFTYRNLPGEPQFAAVLSDWDLSPRLPDLLFSFVPPDDASRIEFLPVGGK